MGAQTYNVNIEGYWRHKNKEGIPNHSGLYFVYETFYNQKSDSITLLKLLFVGQAENVHGHIKKGGEENFWKEYVNVGNELAFSSGFAETSNLDRLEAAYIYRHKPPCNKKLKDTFPFDQTTVFSTGKTALLDTQFTIQRI
jgi:hypothetical protein